MDTMKDRNGTNLTEAEDIKKRWQEYTKLYKKDLNDPDKHDAVITHLDPDILECKIKQAFSTNKVSGGDGILVELFKILNIFPPAKTIFSRYKWVKKCPILLPVGYVVRAISAIFDRKSYLELQSVAKTDNERSEI